MKQIVKEGKKGRWTELIRAHASRHGIKHNGLKNLGELTSLLWKHYVDVHYKVAKEDIKDELLVAEGPSDEEVMFTSSKWCPGPLEDFRTELEVMKQGKKFLTAHAAAHNIPGTSAMTVTALAEAVWEHYNDTHAGEEDRVRHACTKCPVSYAKPQDLQEHLNEAHDERLEHSCNQCEFRRVRFFFCSKVESFPESFHT